jgi:hypothetical protein
MAVTIAFTGGRPATISAATGAIALIVAPLAKEHGLDYLIAAVVLGGVLQVVLAVVGVAKLMRFIPRSVMVGFVNALAILIFAISALVLCRSLSAPTMSRCPTAGRAGSYRPAQRVLIDDASTTADFGDRLRRSNAEHRLAQRRHGRLDPAPM